MHSLKMLACAFMPLFLFNSVMSAQQINIPAIDNMPSMPSPYEMINWHELAKNYDNFVYDINKSGQYLPLTWINNNTVNYPHPGFGLHTVVGTNSPGSAEAINLLPSLVGASLVGIDKSNQNGSDYVLMSEEFFNKKNGQNIYLNHPSSSSGDDWWYETMPNVFFYQLYNLYPGTGDFKNQFKLVADRWLEAVYAMGGKTTPWKVPFMNYRAFNFAEMKPNSSGVTEPEAAGAIAWILYNAYIKTKEDKYRIGSELAMEFLNSLNYNPSYEIQMPYGAYIAAKMNAIEGTYYDIEKMVRWCFSNYQNRNWGVISGNWGGYDVHGLIGEVNGSNDYAFLMNTFQQAAAMIPMVRYDDRFAAAMGKWMLNAANAARLFYPKYLPDLKQDSEEWSKQYDTLSVIGHEALRQSNFGVSPYATGDAVSGGWGKTNLTLYSSSHVGYFGGIIDTTDVPGILKLDLLKTDFYKDEAYPTFLLYNSYEVDKTVTFSFSNNGYDIYDAVSNRVILTNGSGESNLTISALSAIVAVVIPAGSSVTTNMNRSYANGIVIDYSAETPPANYPPRIKSLAAFKHNMLTNDTVKIFCTAEDRDNDSLTYEWFSENGKLSGSGSSVDWIAPESIGTFLILCIVTDSEGLSDTALIDINVQSIINTPPVIIKLSANPRKMDVNSTTQLLCTAEDAEGDTISFNWSSDFGSFSEADSTVLWYSPVEPGNYYVRCTVVDNQSGSDTDSILVAVRDFSEVQTGNLIAFFPLNGNAEDASGNSNNGIISGAVSANDRFGNINSAFSFDGVDDNIRVPNTAQLNFNNSITVNFWMMVTSFFDREQHPISHGNWENRWKISITDKKVRWTIKTSIGIKDVDSETELQLNKHYNVCAVYNGSDLEIYLNGNLDGITSFSGNILETTHDLMLGQVLPGNKNYNFKGILDDIRIFDYALPFSEIQKLYDPNTSVGDNKEQQINYDMFSNYPNPFNGETAITFYLSEPGDIILSIYSLLGEKIKTLFSAYSYPDKYTFKWDGKNDHGSSVSSGIYFCVLKTNKESKQIKLMMLK